ncbi:hypothetical protein AB0F13_01960 [Streptomyces sp. NPDC026206]|uniref:hypothetical protein n=1 Tax=Streptomyces sp. NPDC026206 TaxID=3157089 RepID=UPI0033CCA51F
MTEAQSARTGDALRAKVADANERSRRGRGHPGAAVPPLPRCQTCWDIKRRRYRALDAGDRQEAARMAEVMGLHQREAHSE